MKALFLFLFGLSGCLAPMSAEESDKVWDMAGATAVLYNSSSEESTKLAKHYAAARGIPEERLIGIEVPDEDAVGRDEFEKSIRTPIREELIKRGWLAPDPQSGPSPVRVLVTCRGLPYLVHPRAPGEDQTAASVDSELAALGLSQKGPAGSVRNPYYDEDEPFGVTELPGLFLVGRLDGPSWEIATRLVDDAIETEKKGLWGMAYIDQWNSGRGGYATGDRWLQSALEKAVSSGLPTVLDAHKTRYGFHYPMNHAVLYLGWYTWNVDGPFLNPEFRFKKGAIATHLHSFSATNLRQTEKEWTGPLLAKGAAGVLGNVWEPTLGGTTHFDLFADRLLDGYTLGEAAWMATPGLSWMNVVIGDPLYRPFGPAPKGSGGPFEQWKTAVASKSPDAMTELEKEAKGKSGNPVLQEALGLRDLNEGRIEEAFDWLQRAADRYPDPMDRLRTRFHVIGYFRSQGADEKAILELRRFLESLTSDDPRRRATQAYLDQLDPPGPPPLKPDDFLLPTAPTVPPAPIE